MSNPKDFTHEPEDSRGALKAALAELSTIYAHMPGVVMAVDREGRVRKVNELAARLSGRSPEEMIGLRGGEALRCVHHLDDPEGCGAGPACAQCPLHLAVLGTFADRKGRENIEVWLPFQWGETVEDHCLLVSTAYVEFNGDEGLLVFALDITDNKRREEALRESEEKYKILVKNAHELILVAQDGRIRFINHRVFDLLGYRPEEMIEKPFIDFIHHEDRRLVADRYAKRLKGEHVPDLYSFRVINKTGETKWFQISAVRIEWEGKPATLNFLADITETRQAEKSLREELNRLQRFLDTSDAIIVELDASGMVTMINQYGLKLLGCEKEQILGKNWFEVALPQPEGMEIVYSVFQKLIEGDLGSAGYFENEILTSSGERRMIAWRNTYLSDADGVITGTLSIGIDITEQKRSEEELRLNAKRTATLLELSQMKDQPEHAISDFALESSLEITNSRVGYLAFLNEDETVLTMYSWSRAALRECKIQDKPVEFQVAETGLWGEAVRQRRPIITNDYSKPNPLKKGYPDGHVRVLRHMNVPVFDGDRIVLLAGVGNKPTPYDERDVQQLTLLMDALWRIIKGKRADEEQKKLQAQFLQAQKMESVGRLAGGMAHDFNNMLNVIIGYAQLALAKVEPGGALYSDLQEILGAGRRSAVIVQQLLAFARKQTISPKVLDLNHTVEGLLKMLRRLIGEEIDLSWKPDTNLWLVKMDPSQVHQILANLCVNARDAISGVGKITIETKNVHLDEAYCESHAGSVPGDYVMLAVSDDGCGMDKETLERVFEPFFTTKEVGKGTGLGLSTVYGIVKQNGGFIYTYSEPGKGTTFRIYLKQHKPQDQETRQEEAASMSRGHGETVLLVEDEPRVLKLGKKMLEGLHYTVLTAATPAEALRVAETHPGEIHLLITDVVMPQMSGRELAERILGLRPRIRCLYMSGYAADAIAHHGVLDEGMHFIQKPFGVQELASKVRDVLQQDG